MSGGGSYFLEDRSQPLVNPMPTSLNETLRAEYINVPAQDQSFRAGCTRMIAGFVGTIFSPKQLLAILRVHKAITLCFIVLSILANIMYVLFVEILAGSQVREMAGGVRDMILRFYALLLLFLALAVEIDFTRITKRYSGLKSFIPRSLLYVFIALLTVSYPVETQQVAENGNEYANDGDDAANNDDAANDDAYAQNDDAAASYADASYESSVNIPTSAVGFQMVASFVL